VCVLSAGREREREWIFSSGQQKTGHGREGERKRERERKKGREKKREKGREKEREKGREKGREKERERESQSVGVVPGEGILLILLFFFVCGLLGSPHSDIFAYYKTTTNYYKDILKLLQIYYKTTTNLYLKSTTNLYLKTTTKLF